MITVSRIPLNEVPWHALDAYQDRSPFQTRAWLEYLTRSQRGEPVVASIADAGRPVGYFTGVIVRKMGLRILGSPFRGWGTPYLGFNVAESVERHRLIEPLVEFAFRSLGCHFVEIVDRGMPCILPKPLRGGAERAFETMEIDLRQSEDAIFAAMESACRRCIRKAEKSGVTIEEARAEGFAEEYYAQLEEVFAKNGRSPPYGIDRPAKLIECVHPTGDLLLLRARSANGDNIATGIFPGRGSVAYFWGGASWRQHQHLRPNELLMWAAFRYWKARGITSFDMGGFAKYKQKFGARRVSYQHLVHSRYGLLIPLRDAAQRAWHLRWSLRTPRLPVETTASQGRSAIL